MRGVATVIAEVILVSAVLVLGVGLVVYASSQLARIAEDVGAVVAATRASTEVQLLSYSFNGSTVSATLLASSTEPVRVAVIPLLEAGGTLEPPPSVGATLYSGETVLLPLTPVEPASASPRGVYLHEQGSFYSLEELGAAGQVSLVELYLDGGSQLLLDLSIETGGPATVVLHYAVRIGDRYYEFARSQPVEVG